MFYTKLFVFSHKNIYKTYQAGVSFYYLSHAPGNRFEVGGGGLINMTSSVDHNLTADHYISEYELNTDMWHIKMKSVISKTGYA